MKLLIINWYFLLNFLKDLENGKVMYEKVFGVLLFGVNFDKNIGVIIGCILDVDVIYEFGIWVIDSYGKYVD